MSDVPKVALLIETARGYGRQMLRGIVNHHVLVATESGSGSSRFWRTGWGDCLRAELRASKPVYREYGKAERECSDLARTLRDRREIYVSKGAADLIRKVAEANAAIRGE